MRFHAVYRRLYFWLGSALVALMDTLPLVSWADLMRIRGTSFFTIAL